MKPAKVLYYDGEKLIYTYEYRGFKYSKEFKKMFKEFYGFKVSKLIDAFVDKNINEIIFKINKIEYKLKYVELNDGNYFHQTRIHLD